MTRGAGQEAVASWAGPSGAAVGRAGCRPLLLRQPPVGRCRWWARAGAAHKRQPGAYRLGPGPPARPPARRHLHQAYLRVGQGNYALDGLVGREMFGKTVGVVGTGAIGAQACRILKGIGCRVLAHDLHPSKAVQDLGVEYLSLDELLPQCDILSLHCPLMPSTRHMIDRCAASCGGAERGLRLSPPDPRPGSPQPAWAWRQRGARATEPPRQPASTATTSLAPAALAG
jgi:hypothetical protein